MLSLNMLGKNKFWAKEYWKYNLFKVMFFSVIPLAIVVGIIDYLHIQILIDFKIIIGSILTGLSIALICDAKAIKDFGKIMFLGTVGFLTFIFIDLINAIIIVYGAKVNIVEFNTSPYLNFFIGTPERIVQYCFLIYVFIKKNCLSQVDFNKLLSQNKQLKYILIGFTTLAFIMLIFIIKYIFWSNILEPLSTDAELVITILTLSSVIFIAIVPWLIAMNIYSNEKYLKRYGKEEFYYEEQNI
jgi:hypothetical protein